MSKLDNFDKFRKEKEAEEKLAGPKIDMMAKEKKFVDPSGIIEQNIVLENNLKVVNDLIRKHGIVQVSRYSKHKQKKMAAQERFLNILDMLYDKAIKTQDVKAAIEYLNRTAGSVAQTFDLNESRKKLIMMGTMQSKGEQKKDEYLKTIKKVPAIAKKEDE